MIEFTCLQEEHKIVHSGDIIVYYYQWNQGILATWSSAENTAKVDKVGYSFIILPTQNWQLLLDLLKECNLFDLRTSHLKKLINVPIHVAVEHEKKNIQKCRNLTIFIKIYVIHDAIGKAKRKKPTPQYTTCQPGWLGDIPAIWKTSRKEFL